MLKEEKTLHSWITCRNRAEVQNLLCPYNLFPPYKTTIQVNLIYAFSGSTGCSIPILHELSGSPNELRRDLASRTGTKFFSKRFQIGYYWNWLLLEIGNCFKKNT